MLAICNYGRIFTTPAGNCRNSFFENRLEAEFRVGGSYAARLSRSLSYSGPGLGCGHAPRNCRMRVEQPLDPLRGRTLSQILTGQFVHSRDKRRNRRDGSESIAVGLTFVKAGVRIQQWQHQQRTTRDETLGMLRNTLVRNRDRRRHTADCASPLRGNAATRRPRPEARSSRLLPCHARAISEPEILSPAASISRL